MAHRQALRELQSRLAERLQAAHGEGLQASWLAVQSAGAGYLLPLSQSGEIFPFVEPQPVPYTQPWFVGVANLRGALWGAVDLGAFLAGQAPPVRPETARAQLRLVTFNPALDINCALLVEHLAGLRSPEAFAASAPPAEGTPSWLGSTYTDPEGACWQEVNLQALSQQPQFLGIGA